MTRQSFRSLAQAVERYYDDLRRFVRKRTGSDSLADEVVHDTWLRAVESSVAMPQNAKAYVFRMAENLAKDHFKKERTKFEREAGDDQYKIIASDAPTLEAVLTARQELDVLVEAVRDLPEKRRRIFILYRGYGLTMRQIAARLGLSQKTVENQIARAMVECRKRLRDAGRDL